MVYGIFIGVSSVLFPCKSPPMWVGGWRGTLPYFYTSPDFPATSPPVKVVNGLLGIPPSPVPPPPYFSFPPVSSPLTSIPQTWSPSDKGGMHVVGSF